MSEKIIVREATLEDLDDVTAVVLRGIASERHWKWRFKHANEHIEEHKHFTRKRYFDFISDDNNHVMVAFQGQKMISISVWHLNPPSGQEQSPRLPADDLNRPDANKDRLKIWRTTHQQGHCEHFDKLYRDGQLHLVILSTLPEYQGEGATLIEWCKAEAKKVSLPVVVTAPAEGKLGASLYIELGFMKVGSLHFQVDGEQDYVELIALAFES